MPDLPRPTFDLLLTENGGMDRFTGDLARGVATQLQPVETIDTKWPPSGHQVAREPQSSLERASSEPHPDRALLDDISDPMARAVYGVRLEDAERRGRTWIDQLVPPPGREVEDYDDDFDDEEEDA